MSRAGSKSRIAILLGRTSLAPALLLACISSSGCFHDPPSREFNSAGASGDATTSAGAEATSDAAGAASLVDLGGANSLMAGHAGSGAGAAGMETTPVAAAAGGNGDAPGLGGDMSGNAGATGAGIAGRASGGAENAGAGGGSAGAGGGGSSAGDSSAGNGGSAGGAAGTGNPTNVSGVIFNQTWTKAGSPYVIVGNLSVASLTIQPGVSVQAAGGYEIRVVGTLSVQGDASSPVTFAPTAQNKGGWGGLIFDSSNSSTLSRFTLSGATQSGISITSSQVTLKNCVIQNNRATQGGGLFVQGATSKVGLSNCIVANNSADDSFEAGAGLFVGTGATVALQNCIFHDNTTVYANARGGAIYACAGTTTIVNSTIVKNGDSVYGAGSGAIAVDTGGLGNCGAATVEIRNSILFNNTAFDVSGSGVTINYSDVQTGYTGVGNLAGNPVFADSADHLFSGASPCIDGGDPSLAMNDACSSPALGTSRNDIGAYGGPLACAW